MKKLAFLSFVLFLFSCNENLDAIKDLERIINVDLKNEYKIRDEESPVNLNDTYYSITIIVPNHVMKKVLLQVKNKFDSIDGLYYLNIEEQDYSKHLIIYKDKNVIKFTKASL